jgi:uncharacterized protein
MINKFTPLFLMLITAATVTAGPARAGAATIKGRMYQYDISEMTFYSRGTRCAATLYLPKGIAAPPVVIMGNGFGGERKALMPAFAERFARRGMACFLFDYRNFGDSGGTPRNLVSHSRHLADWQAAVAQVRTMKGLNTKKIALWGTSYSGGHVIVTAATVPGITAIVAQVPFVDGLASTAGYPLKNLAKGFFHGMWDLLESFFTFGRYRHYVPITCEPDTFGILNTPGSLEGLKKIMPPDWWGRKMNGCPAIVVFTLPLYRPTGYADGVTCPALVIHAEKDNLIPLGAVKKAVSKMKHATYVGMPLSHFDIYKFTDTARVNQDFERVVKLEEDFLAVILMGK